MLISVAQLHESPKLEAKLKFIGKIMYCYFLLVYLKFSVVYMGIEESRKVIRFIG